MSFVLRILLTVCVLINVPVTVFNFVLATAGLVGLGFLSYLDGYNQVINSLVKVNTKNE